MTAATVFYHEELDGWWAESPEFPSFFAAGDTYEETKEHVRSALYALSGEPHLGLRHLIAPRTTAPMRSEHPTMEKRPTGLRGLGDFVLSH